MGRCFEPCDDDEFRLTKLRSAVLAIAPVFFVHRILLTVGHYLAWLLVVDWVDGVVDGWSSLLLWSVPL